MNTNSKCTVVIAGAGYAGLAAARTLSHHSNIHIVLIDQHDYHLLQFQLHEAAVNKIDTESLALPISNLLPRDVEFVKATIDRFDFGARVVITDRGRYAYDRLIVALGSQPATYHIPGLNEHALMLKSLANARKIRGHLEMIMSALAARPRSTPYPIVIGGAGITGVELAAELSEGVKGLARDYQLERGGLKLVLVEAAPTVLPGFDRKTIDEAAHVLQRSGVDVRVNTRIDRVEADRVIVKSIWAEAAETLETQTLIWTGGVRANALVLNSGLSLGERGAAIVDEYLRSLDRPEVSIVGDSAVVRDPHDGRIVMPCGQLAVKQGQYAAQQILADLTDEVHGPYIPRMDGLLISLGSYRGVGTVGPVWVRRLIARVAKIGAETRYLFNVGGVKLLMARWLLLRAEWVRVARGLRFVRRVHWRTLLNIK
jgi:NADH dehydrogenase